MSDTEDMQRTPRQHKDAIRELLANLPENPDHNGHHDQDRAQDAAIIAGLTAPEPVADPGPHSMIRNRAQGHSGPAVAAPPPPSTRAAVRAKLANLDNNI